MTVTSSKKINALFMVPTLMRGGAETQAIDLINGIDDSKFDKHLLVFEKQIDQLDRLDKKSVTFHHEFRSSKFNFSFIRRISKLIDDYDIEVIHCTLQVSLLFAWLACLFAARKPKLIVAIHTTKNVSNKNELIDRLLYRPLMRACTRIIFVCHTQKDFWLKKYPELTNKSEVVYNGVDIDYFDADAFRQDAETLKKKLMISSDDQVLVCVAGFRREKAHDLLLEVFSKLPSSVHLILAGDGLLRTEIEFKINELKISERTHLLGNISDVRPVLAASDISVLASVAVETFSIAMLESMSMCVPFISSDIGGLAEAIEVNVTGDVVAVNDANSLYASLSKYLLDKDKLKQMGINSRMRVEKLFSQKQMVTSTEKILQDSSIS